MAGAKRTDELRVVVHDHKAGERWLRPALIPVGDDETIYLDDPAIDEKMKQECYAVLAHQIPWLHEKIRTAIRRYGLGQDVQQDDAVAAKQLAEACRINIANYKAAGIKAPYPKLAALLGISVEALRKRLKRK